MQPNRTDFMRVLHQTVKRGILTEEERDTYIGVLDTNVHFKADGQQPYEIAKENISTLEALLGLEKVAAVAEVFEELVDDDGRLYWDKEEGSPAPFTGEEWDAALTVLQEQGVISADEVEEIWGQAEIAAGESPGEDDRNWDRIERVLGRKRLMRFGKALTAERSKSYLRLHDGQRRGWILERVPAGMEG